MLTTIYRRALRSILIAVALLAVDTLSAADAKTTADVCWQRAIDAYTERRYADAVADFEQVAALGYHSADLYYNLGNAYFKLGQERLNGIGRSFASGELGRAVLNYRRALRLDPSMTDARYNLELAVDYTNDTQAIPEPLIASLWHSLRDKATSNSWATLSLFGLALALVALLVYLLAERALYRKIAFALCVVLVLLFVLFLSLSLSQRAAMKERTRAVVICNDTTPVHASPDSASKVIRQPSQGVTLTTLRSHEGWCEILFADGEKGWIRTSQIELI